MLETILDVLLDVLKDTAKLIPFLFLTYLAMEYVEHKAGEKAKERISKSGNYGPAVGAILGAFPQCGFSAAASTSSHNMLPRSAQPLSWPQRRRLRRP